MTGTVGLIKFLLQNNDLEHADFSSQPENALVSPIEKSDTLRYVGSTRFTRQNAATARLCDRVLERQEGRGIPVTDVSSPERFQAGAIAVAIDSVPTIGGWIGSSKNLEPQMNADERG